MLVSCDDGVGDGDGDNDEDDDDVVDGLGREDVEVHITGPGFFSRWGWQVQAVRRAELEMRLKL